MVTPDGILQSSYVAAPMNVTSLFWRGQFACDSIFLGDFPDSEKHVAKLRRRSEHRTVVLAWNKARTVGGSALMAGYGLCQIVHAEEGLPSSKWDCVPETMPY